MKINNVIIRKTWFIVLYRFSIHLNAVSVLHETILDSNLTFAVILKWWYKILLQNVHHFDVLGERFVDVSFVEQTLGCFLEHFGVLNSLQTFQNVRKFTAFNASNHKFITIDWYGNHIVTVVASIASEKKKLTKTKSNYADEMRRRLKLLESNFVSIHFGKNRPILFACFAITIEPVGFLELWSTRALRILTVNGAIILSYHIAGFNRTYCIDHHWCLSEIANDARIAWMVE